METTIDVFHRLNYEHFQRRLPQCIIIGSRKSGTRALLRFLSAHPRMAVNHEEMHFFDRDENYARGLEWYRSSMPLSIPGTLKYLLNGWLLLVFTFSYFSGDITIEKTPSYFHETKSIERIHRMNSAVKLILIVREPVERTISDWYQLDLKRKKLGQESIPFENHVLKRDGTINASAGEIERSKYSVYYRMWTDWFSPRQIHVVDGDKFAEDPSAELMKVEEFLQIPRVLTPDKFMYNATKGFFCVQRNNSSDNFKCLNEDKGRPHPSIAPSTVTKLRQYFTKFNRRFEKFTEQSFDWPEY